MERDIIIMRYNTQQRNAMLALFEQNVHASFTARQIHDLLDDKKVGISTIYRNLDEMVKLELLTRVSGKNRNEMMYRYFDPEGCSGKIHLICSDCSAMLHIDSDLSDKVAALLFDEQNFKMSSRAHGIYGICAECQNNENRGEDNEDDNEGNIRNYGTCTCTIDGCLCEHS